MPTAKRERQKQGRAARLAALEAARERQRKRKRIRNIGVGVVAAGALIAVGAVVFKGDKKNTSVSTQPSTTLPPETTTAAPPIPAAFGTTACPNPDGSSAKTQTFAAGFQKCITDGKTYTATITTDLGVITVAFDPARAPVTVNNFVSLARFHYFDGLTFHRVIPDFVLQGGDPKGNGSGDPGYKFGDELPQPSDYKEGSLAMANSGPGTNGSQFFVVVSAAGAKTLVEAVGGTANYTLFGQVTSGMDVVHKIEADGDPSGTPKIVHRMVTVTIAETDSPTPSATIPSATIPSATIPSATIPSTTLVPATTAGTTTTSKP